MSADRVPPEMLAMAYTLVCALNNADLPEPTRLLGAKLTELTFGDGYTSLRVDRLADLADLIGVHDTHLQRYLDGLIEAKIIQYSTKERKVFEVLPHVHEWKVRWRCPLGLAGLRELAAKVAACNRQYRRERDFGELEMTFQRDPINAAAAEASRESAFAEQGKESQPVAAEVSRPSRPGAAGGRSTTPPGITGEQTPAGPKPRLREMVRQASAALRSATEVTRQVTLPGHPPQEPGSEVTRDVTSNTGCKFPGSQSAVREERKVTRHVTSDIPGGFSPARASDDHLNHLSHPDHLPSQSKQLSSPSDDQGDEGRGDEREVAEGRQMVRLDDDLLGDLQRTMGQYMGSHTDDWRWAIHLARPCVYLALESTKNNQPRIKTNPGGYLLQCFLDQCERRGYELPPNLFRARRARRRERGGPRR